MMTVKEDEHLRRAVPANSKKAAVLITIDLVETPSIVLIKRRPHPKDHHSGQISLPGGKTETADASLLDTALRETHEEIGVPSTNLDVFGALSPLYIPVSNFEVHPFVALLTEPVVYSPQASEVDDILFLGFRELFTDPIPRINIETPFGFQLKDVPYFPVNQQVVWGATAMILSEFAHILRSYPNFTQIFKSNLI